MKFFSVALFSGVLASHESASPISQVLDLLQKLYDTVVADGETEQKQYQVFTDWCENQAKERNFEIKTGQSQAADFRATIEKSTGDVESLNSQISELGGHIASNESDLKAASEIRRKEHSSFQKEEQELVDTVDTLNRAQSVLSRQLQRGGSFAQMPKQLEDLTSALNVILDASVFSIRDKTKLRAFMQSQENEDGVSAPEAIAYESHSHGILDTLADMQEKAEGMLADARKTEVKSRHNFELLEQSLKDELRVQREKMSNAKKQAAEAAGIKAAAEGDLASTLKDLTEDQQYVKELHINCERRAADFETSQKSRAEELHALSEGRRIIAEATGGAAQRQYGFIQVSSKDPSDALFQTVQDKIKVLGKSENSFMLTQLAGQIRAAVSTTDAPFSKVKKLIEDMINRLVVEGQQEASHKAFCDEETAENEAKRAKMQATINKLSTRIEKAVSNVATLKGQISELQGALYNMAKSQAAMDDMRQKEHEEYVTAKADFEQGLQGVRTGLKILRDYYQNKGEALVQEEPTVGVHSKSSDSGDGVISILEVAESDFARSLAEAEAAEGDAQNAYDKTSQENRVSTAMKKTAVEGKTQEVGRLEQSINDNQSDRNGVQEELSAVMEYLEKLRPQCTTQPVSYEERKKRRESEIKGLKEAYDILENETAFTQQGTSSFLALRSIRIH